VTRLISISGWRLQIADFSIRASSRRLLRFNIRRRVAREHPGQPAPRPAVSRVHPARSVPDWPPGRAGCRVTSPFCAASASPTGAAPATSIRNGSPVPSPLNLDGSRELAKFGSNVVAGVHQTPSFPAWPCLIAAMVPARCNTKLMPRIFLVAAGPDERQGCS